MGKTEYPNPATTACFTAFVEVRDRLIFGLSADLVPDTTDFTWQQGMSVPEENISAVLEQYPLL